MVFLWMSCHHKFMVVTAQNTNCVLINARALIYQNLVYLPPNWIRHFIKTIKKKGVFLRRALTKKEPVTRWIIYENGVYRYIHSNTWSLPQSLTEFSIEISRIDRQISVGCVLHICVGLSMWRIRSGYEWTIVLSYYRCIFDKNML